MYRTNKLGIAVAQAVVVPAARTDFGLLLRTAIGSVNLVVDAHRLDHAASSQRQHESSRDLSWKDLAVVPRRAV